MNDAQHLRSIHLEGLASAKPDDLRQAVTAKRLGCHRADFAEAARVRALRAWDLVAEQMEGSD